MGHHPRAAAALADRDQHEREPTRDVLQHGGGNARIVAIFIIVYYFFLWRGGVLWRGSIWRNDTSSAMFRFGARADDCLCPTTYNLIQVLAVSADAFGRQGVRLAGGPLSAEGTPLSGTYRNPSANRRLAPKWPAADPPLVMQVCVRARACTCITSKLRVVKRRWLCSCVCVCVFHKQTCMESRRFVGKHGIRGRACSSDHSDCCFFVCAITCRRTAPPQT